MCEMGLFNADPTHHVLHLTWLSNIGNGTPKQSAYHFSDGISQEKNLYYEMHPDLCAVYAAHRLYSALFSTQLQYCTLPFLISLSRLIMVLQMIVLSETVFVSVIHQAC